MIHRTVTAAVAALFLVGVGTIAQQTERRLAPDGKYVISAEAGGVNYTDGTVGVVRRSGQSGRLTTGDKLKIGDRVSTGAGSRAEILLNPGSYLRLDENSAFEFVKTSLDELTLRVDRGSAFLEVFATDEFAVTIIAPDARFRLIDSGIYRVDVAQNGTGTLSVWSGRATIPGLRSNQRAIKAGQTATMDGRNVSIAKFKRDGDEPFAAWSKSRGKQLAKVTNNLKRKQTRDLLTQSFAGGQWNIYNSFGLWIFDGFSGSYSFLPFGYGWASPYGYWYDRSLYWLDMPWVFNTPPHSTGGVPTAPNPPTMPNTQADTPTLDRRGGLVPPFARIGAGADTRGGDVPNEPGFPPVRRTPQPPIFAPPPPASPKIDPGDAMPSRKPGK